jgi:thiol-disulfide isomerase/thioredoxin
MKKIILIAIAVFAMLIPVKAKHIYFREGFDKGFASANLSEEDSKTDKILYWNYSSPISGLASDTTALFGYFPNGGLSNVPDRTNPCVRMVSSWQKLNRAENWVSFDWYYAASLNPNAEVSLGVAIRTNSDDSAWIVIKNLVGGKDVKLLSERDNTGPVKTNVKIPESIADNGDSLQIAVFINYQSAKNLLFLFHVDNISLVSFDGTAGQPRASLGINTSGAIVNLNDVIVAEVANESDVAIKKIKLGYIVNGGDVKYQTRTLTTYQTLNMLSKTSFNFNPEGLVNGSGDNNIRVWIAGLNETDFSAGEGGDTIDFSIYMPDTANAVYPTKLFVEHFTASTCSPCKNYNTTMNPVYKQLEDEGKIIYIKYQMNFPGAGDPYYVPEIAGVRAKYYDIVGVPSCYGNATEFYGQNNNSDGTPGLRPLVNAFAGTKSYFDISLDSAHISADSTIYVKYKITSKIPAELTVQTAVFEQTTYKNKGTNGETSFPHVTMKMFPDGNGNIVNFKKDSTYEFVYEYDMSKTFMEEISDLRLVVFIQNDVSRVIYSASQREVSCPTEATPAPSLVSENPVSFAENTKTNFDMKTNTNIFSMENVNMNIVAAAEEEETMMRNSAKAANNYCIVWVEETANETYANILPIKVSPNPASEYVNVESPENACIFLYNNAGTPVYEGTVKAGATKKLSLAKYATGVYILKVVSDKGIATEKIIKK